MTNTILITGASSGIGRATARYFHGQGWNVVATMRSPHNETELTALDRVFVTRLDVEDPASIEQAVAAGITQFGRIDALLNNAGYGAYGPLEATPMENVRRQFEVNVFGLIATTKALLPHFRANQSGTVVNISSIGGRMTFPLGTLYHGSKFAVEGLMQVLADETDTATSIRVNSVNPGGIRTSMRAKAFPGEVPETLPTPESVLGPFLYLLGPDGRGTTGRRFDAQ